MAFLKRLTLLIGFIVAWCILALALPWIFAAIGAAILAAAVLHMARAKQAHDAGIFFSSVAVITLGLSGGGFVMGHKAGAMLEEHVVRAVEAEVGADAEAPAAEPEEKAADAAAPEPTPEAAPDRAAAIKDATALPKDKARCLNLDEVAAAWGTLAVVQKSDKDYKKARVAAKGLETCRKKAAAKLKPKERKTALAAKGMAKPLKLP